MESRTIVAALMCLAAAAIVRCDEMKLRSAYSGGNYGPGGAYPPSGAYPPNGDYTPPNGGNGANPGPGATIPSPPCPKNYLFSCQPQLVPAPCAPAGGMTGAYSENRPVYALPVPQYINGYPSYQLI